MSYNINFKKILKIQDIQEELTDTLNKMLAWDEYTYKETLKISQHFDKLIIYSYK